MTAGISARARRRRSPHGKSLPTSWGFRTRPARVHERVGEVSAANRNWVSEDLVLFATMKLGRPVKWEWSREEEFHRRHDAAQMTTRVKIGARKDGTLTRSTWRCSRTPAPMAAMAVKRWQPRWRARSRLSLREQEGHRPCCVHQHDSAAVSRLWRLADHLRGGMCDRRAGKTARHRPVRDAAQECGAARRQHRIDLEGSKRCQLRQLWHR